MKQLIILIFILAPFSTMAQPEALKLGHYSSREIYLSMPEMQIAEKQLQELTERFEKNLRTYEQEYEFKSNDLRNNSKDIAEEIKKAREEELFLLQEKMKNFKKLAEEAMKEQRVQILIPINQKIERAINRIGNDGDFTYLFDIDTTPLGYISSSKSKDVTRLIINILASEK